jgi:phosphatidylinositol alpha-mannosyltransferase
VAGPGDSNRYLESIPQTLRSRFTFLGKISESEKSDFLRSVSVFVAPNTGGESFGIILAEAMAASAAIVASDIPAFDAVLDHGRAGVLFESENTENLSEKIIALIKDGSENAGLRNVAAQRGMSFDWNTVAEKIFDVYEMAMNGAGKVALASDSKLLGRFFK